MGVISIQVSRPIKAITPPGLKYDGWWTSETVTWNGVTRCVCNVG